MDGYTKRNLTGRLRSARTNYRPSLIVVIQAPTYYDLQAPFYNGREMFDDFFFASVRATARCRKLVNYSNRKRLMGPGDTDWCPLLHLPRSPPRRRSIIRNVRSNNSLSPFITSYRFFSIADPSKYSLVLLSRREGLNKNLIDTHTWTYIVRTGTQGDR